MDQEVTWSARHFGIRQLLTSRITAFEPPHYFQDKMVRGAFKRITHDHKFEWNGSATAMSDVFDFEAPFGPLGRLAEWMFLTGYMKRLIEGRNLVIKQTAESDRWKEFIPAESE
jgi:ligand-binding SRPBCC domain-containing protein